MSDLPPSPSGVLLAVIGTGSIGRRHLEVATQIPGVQAVGIPSRQETAAELQRLGFATASSLAELGGSSGLAVIATETGRHVADGLHAIELGFHVLIEKPLACDASEARRLLDAARAGGRRIAVGYNLRFSDSLARFRKCLDRLGRVHSVHIECRSYLPDWRPGRDYRTIYSARAREGGVLLDLSHEIDYAGWIFGWPTTVSAMLVNTGRLGIESEEAAFLRWRTDRETIVTIELDYLSRPTRRLMRAAGENGTLEWNGVDATVMLASPDGTSDAYQSTQARNDMMAEQLSSFLSTAMGKGAGDDRLATGADGLKTVAVIDAARRASAARAETEVAGE